MQDKPSEGVSDLGGFDGIGVGDVGLVGPGSKRSRQSMLCWDGCVIAVHLYVGSEVGSR